MTNQRRQDLPGIEAGTRDFLKALASETRQDILRLFARGGELSVGEIAGKAGLSPSTTSAHLALMARGGVLVSRRDGKTVLYRADAGRIGSHLDLLREYLDRCCPPAEGRNR